MRVEGAVRQAGVHERLLGGAPGCPGMTLLPPLRPPALACLSLSLCVCLSLSLCLSVSLSVSILWCDSLSLSLCVSVSLSLTLLPSD